MQTNVKPGVRRLLRLAVLIVILPVALAHALTLTWQNNDASQLGVNIERSSNGGPFSLIASVGPTVTTYVDTAVVAGTNYTYRVDAYNSVGDSPYSNTVTNAPTITTAPVSQTVAAFGTAVFTVAASGVPAPTFVWQFNGTNLSDGALVSGSATATLTLTSVSLLSAGNYTAVASNGISPEATSSASLTVNQAVQTISMSNVGYATYSPGGAYNPGATTNSGLPVTYSSSNSSVATASGGTVTIQGAGDTTITASAVGNVDYLAAANVTQTLVVSPATQTIPFSAFPAVYVGSAPITLPATASSGLPITYVSENTNVATVSGNILTIVATGASFADIDAFQAGNANYYAAGEVQQALNITPPVPPSFTTQPSSQSLLAGGNITFTVAASGAPTPTYQWQVSTNGGSSWSNLSDGGVYSGTATASLTITGALAGMTGYKYQALAINLAAPSGIASTAATLTVSTIPSFSVNPTNRTVIAPGNTTFSVTASGQPSPTYQWQYSTNGGSTWNNVANGGFYSGATSSTLTITGATVGLNGYEYQALAINAAALSGVASIAATLTVNTVPTFSGNPSSQTLLAGGNVTFTVAASGQPTPTYQWQVSTNGGTTWGPVSNGGVYSGATTASLTITDATVAMTGYQYEALAINAAALSGVASTAATLTVNTVPTFSGNPSNLLVGAGGNATFTVAASGQPTPTYQWQVSTDGGTTWSPVSNAGVYSGATSATLTITGVTVGMNGYQYQALAINAAALSGVASTAGTLTVTAAPVFSVNPVSQLVASGSILTFTVAASGLPAPTYQWQVSTNGGSSWSNISNSAIYSGATTATLTITGATAGMTGYEYQAIAANSVVPLGVESGIATLTVNTLPVFSVNPANQSVTAGGNVTFTVAASGLPTPTYQWQVSTDGGTTWSPVSNGGVYSGATSPSLTITGATAGMNSFEYEALAVNAAAPSGAPSTAATLTVNTVPAFSTNPTSLSVATGGNATLTAAASGVPAPAFQWQVSINGGATWSTISNGAVYSGATTATLTITGATFGMNGYLYEAVATNAVSNITSNPATLTVIPPAPTITSSLAVSGVQGAQFQYLIVGSPVVSSFSTSTLPAGLIFSSSTGTISGTLTASPNSYNVTIGATNGGGTTSQTLVITVQSPPPVITSPVSANAQDGTTYTTGAPLYTVVATNSPTSYSATVGATAANLSMIGLSINGAGQIIGTPTQTGTFALTLTAANATGSVSQTLTLTIAAAAQAPVFTGNANPSGLQNTTLTYTPAFTGATSYTLVNLANGNPSVLPTGLNPIVSATGTITGIPTQVGTFPLAVQATGAGATTTTQTITLTINPDPTVPVITSASSATGQVGVTYTSGSPLYTLTATPAATSYTLGSLATGISGLSLSGSALVGTASAPGLYSVAVAPVGAAGTGPTLNLALTINPAAGTPVITSSPMAIGTVGSAFTYTTTASNLPTSFVVTAGGSSLTALGLTFASNGSITGTPTVTGQATVYVAGVNADGQGQAVGIEINCQAAAATPVIFSNATAAAQVGVPFTYAIAATNSPTGYNATGLAGTGLTLDPTSGIISGIPAAATAQALSVSLTASNAAGTGNPFTLSLAIAAAPATPVVTSILVATGQVGTALQDGTDFPTYQIIATNAATSYAAQNLPPGLSLAPSTGLITGTPTTAGVFSTTLQAGNGSGLGAAATLVYTILAPASAPVINSGASAVGTAGTSYPASVPLYTITTNPAATSATSFALTGTLPTGLALNTSTGAITGNPGAPGVAVVSVTATTAAGTSQPQPVAITINPAAGTPTITSTVQAAGVVGVAFSYNITATNAAAGPPAVSLDAINLPPGLAVNSSSGAIAGTPTQAGTFVADLYGENAIGMGATADLTVTITAPSAAPAVNSPPAANAQVGQPFAYQMTATNSPSSFQVSAAPAWMTINNASGLLGGTPTAPGSISVILSASNAVGAGNPQSLVVAIAPAANTPVITSTLVDSASLGTVFTPYQITATVPNGQPAATSYQALGLPPGLTLASTTGLITGTPTASGTYPVALSASNTNGQGATATLNLTVNATLDLAP